MKQTTKYAKYTKEIPSDFFVYLAYFVVEYSDDWRVKNIEPSEASK
jgi:hypothetical protein